MEIGNIVRLRSGGPWMTITKLDKDGQDASTTCVWITDDAVHSITVPESCLQKCPHPIPII